jgi:hypothetical protein
MKKIIQAVVVFVVAYFAVYQFFKYQTKINFDNEYAEPEAKHLDLKTKELGFWENFATNIIVKLSESEGGGNFLLKLIKPARSTGYKNEMKTNNASYIDTLFSIQRQEALSAKGSKGKPIKTEIAYCGAEVVIDYRITKGQEVLQEKQSGSLRLGEKNLPALENIIIGMQEGQRLLAHIPYWWAGNLQQFMTSNEEKIAGLELEVTLVKVITPAIKDIKIFDDLVSIDEPIFCGNRVNLNLKISRINGQLIFQGPIDHTLGDKELPLIFSYILFNKLPSSNRTAIVPVSSLKKINLKPAIKLQDLDQDEFILLEFEAAKKIMK